MLSHENMPEGLFPISVFFTNVQLHLSSIGCVLHKLETLMLGQSWCFDLGVFFVCFFPHSIVNTLWSESIQRKYKGGLLLFLLPSYRIIEDAELEETYQDH